MDRLLALLREHDAPAIEWSASGWSASTQTRAPFFVRHGDLSAGFLFFGVTAGGPDRGRTLRQRCSSKPQAKSKAATFLSSLEDLNIGDYVVHVQHGVRQVSWAQAPSVQDFDSDYLILAIFTAATRSTVVRWTGSTRFSGTAGAESHVPRLDGLGGTSWARTTARVKKDIQEMAQELVDLYANRELAKRHSYGYDSTLYHEFEAAFEYEETADQLKAIDDITHDMASSKPMDRLVCGDVGYGKTEVAIGLRSKPWRTAGRWRCSFRPRCWRTSTTTISQALCGISDAGGAVSRFQSPKQATAIVKEIATGSIDVVIGTHRLLQNDVQFRNLGLVIIDEEQWFGVEHKERLKELRTPVDVLTLTATPIPRTLHMAMASVRDLRSSTRRRPAGCRSRHPSRPLER